MPSRLPVSTSSREWPARHRAQRPLGARLDQQRGIGRGKGEGGGVGDPVVDPGRHLDQVLVAGQHQAVRAAACRRSRRGGRSTRNSPGRRPHRHRLPGGEPTAAIRRRSGSTLVTRSTGHGQRRCRPGPSSPPTCWPKRCTSPTSWGSIMRRPLAAQTAASANGAARSSRGGRRPDPCGTVLERVFEAVNRRTAAGVEGVPAGGQPVYRTGQKAEAAKAPVFAGCHRAPPRRAGGRSSG